MNTGIPFRAIAAASTFQAAMAELAQAAPKAVCRRVEHVVVVDPPVADDLLAGAAYVVGYELGDDPRSTARRYA